MTTVRNIAALLLVVLLLVAWAEYGAGGAALVLLSAWLAVTVSMDVVVVIEE